MSWVTVGLMVGNGVLQSRANEKKLDNQKRMNMAEAEVTRYSPWTGMKGQLDNSALPGTEAGFMGGAMTGLAQGQAIKGAGLFTGSSNPSAASEASKNLLGAPDYSSQIAQQASTFQNNIGSPNLSYAANSYRMPSLWGKN